MNLLLHFGRSLAYMVMLLPAGCWKFDEPGWRRRLRLARPAVLGAWAETACYVSPYIGTEATPLLPGIRVRGCRVGVSLTFELLKFGRWPAGLSGFGIL